jgi:LacI family transcriptional regulator
MVNEVRHTNLLERSIKVISVPPMSRVTLKDVAQASGCSFQAASAILGDRPGRFSDELRDRVTAAAERLGYRPSASARTMRSGKTGCVALLRGTQPSNSTLSVEVLGGIVETLAARDTHLAFLSIDEQAAWNEDFLPKALRQWMADGVLVKLDTAIPDVLRDALDRFRIPVVWMNSKQDEACVYPDDYTAGMTATQHLLAMGHRRIAYADFAYDLMDPGIHYSALDRYRGYVTAMAEAEAQPQVINQVVGKHVTEARLFAAVTALSKAKPPTAIVGNGAFSTYPFFHAALRLGWTIPRDLSLITFENTDQEHLGVPLTYMRLPEAAMGCEAATMVLQRIELPARHLEPRVLPLSLQPGATCTPPQRP